MNFRFTCHGKAGGIDIAMVHANGATLFEVDDGKVTKVVQYFDRD